MKSLNIRTFLFGLLVAVSLASYVYINNVPVSAAVNHKCNAVKVLEDQDQEQSDFILPEVQLVKKLLEKGKEILPATRF